MNYFEGFYKNEAPIEFFKAAIKENRLSHAYILDGAKGSGKLTLARMVAASLAAEKSDRVLADKLLSGNSPDGHEFDVPDDKKFIPVDTIREIRQAAYLKPSELEFRFFIVRNAHMINIQGQNALLKLLEEPPAGTYIFLLCESSSSLLPTVRSRAPVIRMQRFTPPEIAEYFHIHGLGENNIQYISQMADGSIGKALMLANEKTDEKIKPELVSAIVQSLSGGNYSKLLISCLALPSDRLLFEKHLLLLQSAIRDMLLSASGKNAELFFKSAEETENARGMLTIKSLIQLGDCICDILAMVDININLQTLKIITAKRLMRATR